MDFLEKLSRVGIFDNTELVALSRANIKSLSDLIDASKEKPETFRPVLDCYIKWFNQVVAPRAVAIATGLG